MGEYLWMDGVKYKKPHKCSAPEYVDLLMSWVEQQINDPRIFPIEDGVPFPKNFRQIVKTILKRLFRVYGHMYHHHIQKIVQLDAEAHLNTCFKHFIYFVKEFKLVDEESSRPWQTRSTICSPKTRRRDTSTSPSISTSRSSPPTLPSLPFLPATMFFACLPCP